MYGLLAFIPAVPLLGSIVIALGGRRLSWKNTALVGSGSTAISAALAVLVCGFYIWDAPGHAVVQHLWTWFTVDGLSPGVSLYLDSLSAVMVLVVAVIAFLIHLYSAAFMKGEEGYGRFFAGMNLFAGSMLLLVMAGDFLLLFLGWEGVGFCSYLLIGFWYRDTGNVLAADKAFIVTRIGDVLLAIGLFIIFTQLGTLDIQAASQNASAKWHAGELTAALAALMLLGGALGKSAQLPFQIWLPDAMAGPSPVSALLHASTMVVSGVYLVARSHAFFELAPAVMGLTALIGALTLLIAGMSALVQSDIKRVMAYSTMSQIGYMFLAMGVGAFGAGIFHLCTHACFKALLFLCAGVIIKAMADEHDMFKMGGLRKTMPLLFSAFMIGSASLAAVPLVTAGFYSKDLILFESWVSEMGNALLWAGGLAGTVLSALYTFRMVFLVFYGDIKALPVIGPEMKGTLIIAPLAVLSFLSVFTGFFETPAYLGRINLFTGFLGSSLPLPVEEPVSLLTEAFLYTDTFLAPVIGVYIAYVLYVRRPQYAYSPAATPAGAALQRFFLTGWGFDSIYAAVFTDRFRRLARVNRRDFIDLFFSGIAYAAMALFGELRLSQAGKLRWYAAGLALGTFILLVIAVSYRTVK